jgi:hypothetical protein
MRSAGAGAVSGGGSFVIARVVVVPPGVELVIVVADVSVAAVSVPPSGTRAVPVSALEVMLSVGTTLSFAPL